jgi:hypothetical protein
MSVTRRICILAIFSLSWIGAFNAHAATATVSYSLDNVFLVDGTQMTGAFDWTYDTADFEGGSGVFTELIVPYWDSADYAFLTVNFDIKNSIEFNRDSLPSQHDEGYGINLKFSPALTPTGSALIDTSLSKFECCGNDFKTQGFRSGGSISPILPSVPLPAAAWLFGSALLGLVTVSRRKQAKA